MLTSTPVPFDDILKQNTFGSKLTFIAYMLIRVKLLFQLEYQRMSGAIADVAKSTGKPPLIFSLCEWGWVSRLRGLSIFATPPLKHVLLESSLDLGTTSRPKLAYPE